MTFNCHGFPEVCLSEDIHPKYEVDIETNETELYGIRKNEVVVGFWWAFLDLNFARLRN